MVASGAPRSQPCCSDVANGGAPCRNRDRPSSRHANRFDLAGAAVNAVMAGCLPEYFPVVVAAFEAMAKAFNFHGSTASTGGSALLPWLAAQLSMTLA